MRLDVKKTYKLFIGGAFPRSESGRSYVVNDSRGNFVANPSQASRKDLRDAVVAAKNAHPQWSSATAYNRGQILYRIAEIMEGRTEQFVAEIVALEGVTPKAALSQSARCHGQRSYGKQPGRQGRTEVGRHNHAVRQQKSDRLDGASQPRERL